MPFSLVPLLSLGCAGSVWLQLGKGLQGHPLPLPLHLTTRDSALLPLGGTVKKRQDGGSGMGKEVQMGFPESAMSLSPTVMVWGMSRWKGGAQQLMPNVTCGGASVWDCLHGILAGSLPCLIPGLCPWEFR